MPLTTGQFKESLQSPSPPAGSSELLQALWYDANGDWAKAHGIAQDVDTRDGSWVHAYLHRKEGDASNAQYWYNRAQKPFSKTSLEHEWEDIVENLLQR